MRLTLLESDRHFFQTAECALVSIVAHAGLVWVLVDANVGGWQLPTDARERADDTRDHAAQRRLCSGVQCRRTARAW